MNIGLLIALVIAVGTMLFLALMFYTHWDAERYRAEFRRAGVRTRGQITETYTHDDGTVFVRFVFTDGPDGKQFHGSGFQHELQRPQVAARGSVEVVYVRDKPWMSGLVENWFTSHDPLPPLSGTEPPVGSN